MPEQETVAPKIPHRYGLTHTSNSDNECASELDRNHVITVVQTKKPLGKRFHKNPDGTVSKESIIKMGVGTAVMYHVSTPESLKTLLEKVGNDPRAAIINSSFEGIEIGETFYIGTARAIERMTGIPKSDRARQKGVHNIVQNGKTYKVIGRFKENVRPSSWQLLDRDNDAHTPEQFSKMSPMAWLKAVLRLIPGATEVTYCHAPSTSSRVLLDGVPVGGDNGHFGVQFSDAADVERFRTAVLVSAVENGMSWRKPRHSRTDPDTVIGYSLTTLIDTSVLTPGRLVFVGKPVVGSGLTVAALVVTIHRSESTPRLDTTKLVLPSGDRIREVTRNAGVEMSVQGSASGLKVTSSDLTLDTDRDCRRQCHYGSCTVGAW
ncbi:MAG: hypothetical protein IPG23_11415 [Burkholderiales bacterium]|nr:hypothetical protein [Burkholderiales bacterium]